MFEINKIYTRETIGIILNTNTKGGQWATGCVSFNNEFYLFITIEGPGGTGHNYNDKFLENGLLEWHGRTGSHVNWPTMQKIINNKTNIYLFIRYNDSPQFKYIGLGKCIRYFDEVPIRIYFDYEERTLKSLEKIDLNEIENISTIKVTEKEILIKNRIGHSQLKKLLLTKQETCQLCDIKREELLIASHIKPWSKSNNNERLDIDNVLLLCPQHDILFDKGFISFSDEGNIIISSILNDDEFPSLNLSRNLRINVNEKQKNILEYHRENILKK